MIKKIPGIENGGGLGGRVRVVTKAVKENVGTSLIVALVVMAVIWMIVVDAG